MKNDYALIDSGEQKKLERFGEYILERPCAQALWEPVLPEKTWREAHASFSREEGSGWNFHKPLPKQWSMTLRGVVLKLALTDFGHLGVFPEHAALWDFAVGLIKECKRPVEILNLFAYSGGASFACAHAGARVCHVDSSKGMVDWARENAVLNRAQEAPIRWIVDDVHKFLHREVKRGRRYDGIILDPPSFGRGASGEVFKLERDLPGLLKLCASVLTQAPLFMLVSAHTPGVSAITLGHLLRQTLKKGTIETGEMLLPGQIPIPCGVYGRLYYKSA